MEPLIIQGTESSPEILFDASANRFIISGRSRPENTGKFYAPIINWVSEFEKILSDRGLKANVNEASVFIFKLEYFNSTSAKHLSEIILLLKDFILKGYNINIEWHYARFDDDMFDTGKEFSNMLDLKFNFIEY